MNVSLVARKHGVGGSHLFNWRKLKREGASPAVTAGESVVPTSEPAAARAQIAQLQRMLGKKTMATEILEEAVEFARKKSGLRARPCQARTTTQPVCSAIGVARLHDSQLMVRPAGWVDGRTVQTLHQPADAILVDALRAGITALPTYGYRRAGALVNRTRAVMGLQAINHKRD